MARQFGTNSNGGQFDDATINTVWAKAEAIAGEPDVRKDTCGARIRRSSHGKTTDLGWEIDHIKPVAKEGTDDLYNLQPLQWENNRHKSDNYPNWTCKNKS